ncbi:MAG: hypothetical protein ACJ768_11825 [Gaiellaceae bacterium]
MTATYDHVNGHMPADPYPGVSFTEQTARADATRLQAEVNAEAARIKATDDAASRATTQAVRAAKAAAEIADLQAKTDEIQRAAAAKAAIEAKARAEQAAIDRAETAERNRVDALNARAEKTARQLVTVSVLIALPLQLVAFWLMNPALIVVPAGLEYAAWVMLAQVDAAVAAGRRAWHYIAATLVVAMFAAWMNWSHGPDLIADHGQLVGAVGAFFSLLGPLTWALHTHGKIAKREGRLPRAERRAAKQAAAAAAKLAEQEQAAATADTLELDARRHRDHADVYARAAYIASAAGHLTITDQTWARAWQDVKGEGAQIGETAESIAQRKAATEALRAATVGDVTPLPVLMQDGRIRVYREPKKIQLNAQIPPTVQRVTARVTDRPKPTPPRRRKGDTPAYSPLARSAAAETAKRAAKQ